MSAIIVNHLKKIYYNQVVVDKISFSIPYGKVTALLGANGAGKSTILNMVAGIIESDEGEIVFGQENYKTHYKSIKSKLGYLTSDMSLYEKLSVYENLKFLGDLKGFPLAKIKRRIEELALKFDLTSFLDKHFGELSSGQKQRSLIASAVLHDPEILIFDEVTASLDIVAAKNIMDFLIEEKNRGKAVLFATHILSEVEYISDSIIIISKGQMLKHTTYQELMALTQSTTLTEAFYQVLKEEKKLS